MGELEAANEEYSIAVRQRSARAAGAGGNGGTRTESDAKAAAGAVKPRESKMTEELSAALRQAPAAADTGRTQVLGSTNQEGGEKK